MDKMAKTLLGKPIFCCKCGKRLEVNTKAVRYDGMTGEPTKVRVTLACPDFAIEIDYIGIYRNGHDSLAWEVKV